MANAGVLDRNSSHTGQNLESSPSSSSRQTYVARDRQNPNQRLLDARLRGHDNPMMRQTAFVLVVLVAGFAPDSALAAAALDGAALRWPWALPFIGILLTIATGPLLFPRVWHHHYGKLAFAWSVLTLAPLAALHGAPAALAAFVHAMLAEYLSFIVLLFALYVVAGGILVTGNLRGTPLVNTAILALGTLGASVVGTTGAAMILVRPLIRANADRLNNVHVVVFFIFLVANIGGALSPLGDPPTVRRLPARGRFLLDAAASVVRDGARRRRGARDLRRDRYPALPQRPAGDDGRGDEAADQARGERQHQFPADRSHRRRHSRLGDMAARHRLRPLRHPGRAAEPGARRRIAPDRGTVARADAERAPRGQRLHMGTDSRSGHFVRRHLHLHHSGARHAASGQGRRLFLAAGRRHGARRQPARPRLFLADGRRSRPSSTMRPPISCSSSSPAAMRAS